MKERDERNSHISSTLHMICISTNNDRHSVPKEPKCLTWDIV